MKTKIFSSVLLSLIIMMMLVPVYIFAADSGTGTIIPCDGVTVPCTFPKLVELGSNLITYLVYLSIPLAAIAFARAGFLYMTAGGSQGKVEKAKELFIKVAWGFFFVLAAWLIVNLITKALLKPEFYTNLL